MKKKSGMKVVILCGGTGYRLKEETEFKPKPMVEVGGKPILWHIMKIYASHGFRDFVIALGYKGNIIKDYFVNKKYYDYDFTLDIAKHKITSHKQKSADKFNITLVDTGLETLTGERVRQTQKYINGDDFMITYGDGLADINISDLLKFHKKQKKMATVSGVYPMLKYGGFDVGKHGLATGFEKKTKIRHLINGGFMVFKKETLKYIKPNSMIEDVFADLILKKQLSIYEHKGFFHAMDTYQDMNDLNLMWNNNPPWKIWK